MTLKEASHVMRLPNLISVAFLHISIQTFHYHSTYPKSPRTPNPTPPTGHKKGIIQLPYPPLPSSRG